MDINILSDINYHILVDLLFRDHKLIDEIYKKTPANKR
jgi:hypothetical protein